VLEQRLVEAAVRDSRAALQARAASKKLPEDLDGQVRSILARMPELSWDEAVAGLVQGVAG
jgi:hypothetical protein